jgi:hypothetical protein
MSADQPTRPRNSPGAMRRSPAPVSQRRFLVRRLGVMVVFVLLVVGVVKVGGALFGGGTSVASASTSTAKHTAGGATTAPLGTGGVPGTGVTGASGAPETSAGGKRHVPTTADPAQILIAGDSDAGAFGPYLEQLLKQTGVATSTLDYKVSSGLSRPDFFDWPAHLQEKVPEVNPDIVVVTFGGNDAQGISDLSGTFIVNQPSGSGDEKWRAEYGKRVGDLMDFLSADGRTLVWVGIPNSSNPEVTTRMNVQNEVVMSEVAKRPNVIFIDTWKRFSGRNGNWAEFVIDPRDGQGKDVRAKDGFHLNQTGAEILALDIAEAVKGELVKRGASF